MPATSTPYMDRLSDEFQQITDGIGLVLERAADEGRDLTEAEQAQIERDDKRRDELETAIKTQSELLERSGRVTDTLGRLRFPQREPERRPVGPQVDDYSLEREFPTPAHYAITLHRALALKDPEAIEKLERATMHQTTADNPGLIPKPVVGPLINTFSARRPFVASITVRDAPAQKFDRPVVTQDVAVDVQAAEKDLTASQKLLTAPLAVSLLTYAGHLNISKQDIRWTQPSILGLVFESFGRAYAKRTDLAACTDFVAAVTQTADAPTSDIPGMDAALGDALGQLPEDVYLDTAWMSPDVRALLTGFRTAQGSKAYDLPVTGSGGDLEGLRVVVDARFPAGTLIVGASEYVEAWEDLEGFLTVDEPDVLGQLVGYAGYFDTLVTVPDAFVKIAVPPPIPLSTTRSRKSE